MSTYDESRFNAIRVLVRTQITTTDHDQRQRMIRRFENLRWQLVSSTITEDAFLQSIGDLFPGLSRGELERTWRPVPIPSPRPDPPLSASPPTIPSSSEPTLEDTGTIKPRENDSPPPGNIIRSHVPASMVPMTSGTNAAPVTNPSQERRPGNVSHNQPARPSVPPATNGVCPAVQQWEYRRVVVEAGGAGTPGYAEVWTPTAIHREVIRGTGPRADHVSPAKTLMAQMGLEGWELVSAHGGVFVFKRPLPS